MWYTICSWFEITFNHHTLMKFLPLQPQKILVKACDGLKKSLFMKKNFQRVRIRHQQTFNWNLSANKVTKIRSVVAASKQYTLVKIFTIQHIAPANHNEFYHYTFSKSQKDKIHHDSVMLPIPFKNMKYNVCLWIHMSKFFNISVANFLMIVFA